MALRKIPKDTKYFHFYNANAVGKSTGDCVIRAFSTALGVSWKDMYRELFNFSFGKSLMLNDPKCYAAYLKSIGWKKMPAPRHLDNTRYTGITFCKEYLKEHNITSPVIAHIGGHHIVCIQEGKVWDTWDSSEGSIGNWWIKEE